MQALPRAVLSVLRELSAIGPLLIAIDDEQWLDPASARVLAFALRRLREEPIAVILARRPEPGGMLSAELGRNFGGDGMETISVEPLPMSTIKVLLEARVKRTISQPLLRRIHQGAGESAVRARDRDRTGDPSRERRSHRRSTHRPHARGGDRAPARAARSARQRRDAGDCGAFAPHTRAAASGDPGFRAQRSRERRASRRDRGLGQPAAFHPSAPRLDALFEHTGVAAARVAPAACRRDRRRGGAGATHCPGRRSARSCDRRHARGGGAVGRPPTGNRVGRSAARGRRTLDADRPVSRVERANGGRSRASLYEWRGCAGAGDARRAVARPAAAVPSEPG